MKFYVGTADEASDVFSFANPDCTVLTSEGKYSKS